jgi:hypothetical protein
MKLTLTTLNYLNFIGSFIHDLTAIGIATKISLEKENMFSAHESSKFQNIRHWSTVTRVGKIGLDRGRSQRTETLSQQ